MRFTIAALCVVVAFVAATPVAAQAVYIQEFMSDPFDGTTSFDANLDGFADSSDDEYIELVNEDTVTVDLAGWEIHDASGLRHKFAASDRMLPPGCAIVVFGDSIDALSAWNSGGRPFGVESSVGFLGLNNTGDTITVYDGDPTMGALVVTAYTFTSSPSPDNGDGFSVTRIPENSTGVFASHLDLGFVGQRGSPGFMNDGSTVYCGVTIGGPAYPGSSGDCAQQVELGGVLQTELDKIHTTTAGDLLGLKIVSPTGTLLGSPFSTVVSGFPTGSAPSAFNLGLPGADIYLNATANILVDGLAGGAFSAVIVPGGYVIGAVVPLGLAGTSALFQSFAFDNSGPFQLCFSDANELVIL